MSTIDDVKARLDIVETVRAYAPDLKKTGRTWKARCPFHSEKTPSFNVDPERGTWHCFGACSTGGDVITFIQKKENLDFKEALRLCAERAGVELRPPSPREAEEREQHARLLAANEAAAVFFQAALAGPDGADARAYATGRGLDDATISTWQLGYAPAGWNGLVDHLTARGFTPADIVDAGLALEGDRGLYDRFRDRLIFPTRDARRRLIGFGARAMRPDDEPKYLNTPQTPLFDKSGNLYGLDRAADSIRREDQAVVVEGYMDVIAAHQFGIDNVVASNGTSITDKQMMLLKRYTERVVLALDADDAGSEAALRGVEVAAGVADHELVATIDWRGLVSYQDVLKADIRVTTLPKGDDPDSLVRRDPEALRALIREALPVSDHLFAAVTKATEAADPRSRSRAVEALLPTVAAMADPVVRSHYVQRLARIGQVDERTVTMLLAQHASGRPRAVATPREVAQAKKQPAAPPDGETQLLRLLVQRREGRGAGIALAHDTFEDAVNRALFAAWAESVDFEERLDEFDESIRERYALLMASALPDYEAKTIGPMVEDMAQRLRLGRAAQRLRSTVVEQAQTIRAARLGVPVGVGGTSEDEATDAVEDLGSATEEFEQTIQRQRELTRAYQRATGRRSASDDDPGERELA
ncbi:MAG: DNA primase [Chloroflexi bacterium]|nr:MAG: DNA primase [Chloroflexota bacterium]